MEKLIIKLIDGGYGLAEARKIAILAEEFHKSRNNLTSKTRDLLFIASLMLFVMTLLSIV